MPSSLESNEDMARPLPPHTHTREGDGLEFERVSFFSDAVYAIAMTLLVVELGVPRLTGSVGDPQAMLAALNDKVPEIVSFFLGFVLIGRYWLAHHQFWSGLRAVDPRLIGINLIYLAFVAFLPFPVALMGEYEQNPISFLIFAMCMAIISALEVVMFAYAVRKDLTRLPVSPEVYRFGLIGSGAPVVVFLLSMPVAFINTTLALCCWLVMIPGAPSCASARRKGWTIICWPAAPTIANDGVAHLFGHRELRPSDLAIEMNNESERLRGRCVTCSRLQLCILVD